MKIIFKYFILFFIITQNLNISTAQNLLEADKASEEVNEERQQESKKVKNNKSFSDSVSEIKDVLTGKKYLLPSIMFDDKEIDDLDRALDSYRNREEFIIDSDTDQKQQIVPKKEDERAKSYIHLSSILYLSNNNWSIWIDDNKISSAINNINNEFYIKSIKKGKVDILWTMGLSKWKILSGQNSEENAPYINENGQVEIALTLKPNQTYILNDGVIVEGKIPQ